MDIVSSFDAEKYFLGLLCKKQHNYESTGLSLRYKKARRCVECAKTNAKNRWERILKENLEPELERRRKYHAKNKEKIVERSTKWRKDNPERMAAKRRERYLVNKKQSFYSQRRWNLILKVLGKTLSNYNQIPLL